VSTNWQPPDSGAEPEPQWSQPPFAPGYQPSASPETPPLPYQSAPYPTSASPGNPTYQAPYQPGYQVPYQPAVPPPLPEALSGSVILPATSVPPPTPAESILRVVTRLLAPILIAAAIFGGLPWFLAIIGIILGGSVLRQVTRDMKRRRIAAAQQQRVLPPNDQELR